MAQANVIVNYAPAQRLPSGGAVRVTAPSPEASRRWGAMLAGALLAGGAIFTLGQFVRPDGTAREKFSPVPAKPALERATPGKLAAAAAPRRQRTLDAELSPPALPLDRAAAPTPAQPRTKTRITTASGTPGVTSEPRRVALSAPAERRIETREQRADAADFAPAPVPRPVGQRRDLEGFLGERGLVLAEEPSIPARPGDGVDPVTAGNLAGDQPRGQALNQAPALAGIPQPDLEPGIAPVLNPAPGEASAGARPLVETVVGVVPPSSASVPSAPLVEAMSNAAPPPSAATPELPLIETLTGPVPPPRAASATARLAADGELPPATTGDTVPSGIAATPTPATARPVSELAMAASAAAPAYVQYFPTAVVNGEPLGALTVRDLGAQGMAVHLGALVELLRLRMPEAEFTRLSTAAAADQFVTLDELRAAGFTVQIDAGRERLLIDAR